MKKLVILSTVALTAMSSFAVPVYAQSAQQQQQVNRTQSLLRQSDRLATKLVMKLEIAKYNQAVKDGVIGNDSLGKSAGISTLSTGLTSMAFGIIGGLGMIAVSTEYATPMGQFSAISSMFLAGTTTGSLVLGNLEPIAGGSYHQVRQLVGLNATTQTALNQIANDAGDMLDLAPEKRQRLADGLKEATLLVVGDNKAVIDVGQVVLDLNLLDPATEVAFRSLREAINTSLTTDQLRLVMMKTDQEKIAHRIEILKALQQEIVNTVKKDETSVADFAPLAARLNVAIAALQAQLN
jgi:hypothetical protein